MIEKVIAAFLYLGWIFPPESGDCDIGKRVTNMIEFGGINEWYGDVITDPEELTLQTPESFFQRFRINMKIHHEVISIHPDRKTVSVKNLENGEIFEENYDKLILSPGAKPTQPRLPGIGIDKLFTLRTVDDTFRIKEYINKNHPKSAVLAGGGFIGLELATKPQPPIAAALLTT